MNAVPSIARRLTDRESTLINHFMNVIPDRFTAKVRENTLKHGRRRAIDSLFVEARIGREVAEFLVDEVLSTLDESFLA